MCSRDVHSGTTAAAAAAAVAVAAAAAAIEIFFEKHENLNRISMLVHSMLRDLMSLIDQWSQFRFKCMRVLKNQRFTKIYRGSGSGTFSAAVDISALSLNTLAFVFS